MATTIEGGSSCIDPKKLNIGITVQVPVLYPYIYIIIPYIQLYRIYIYIYNYTVQYLRYL